MIPVYRARLRFEMYGVEPWLGHWFVFLDKTVYSYNASLTQKNKRYQPMTRDT